MSSPAFAQVCARVKIEIVQELTLERQAFDAQMRITNGLKNLDIEHLKIDVIFRDAAGNPVEATSDPNSTTASFFITLDTSSGVSGDAEQGTGTVAAATAAELNWLIIPAPGAAGVGEDGELYFVGATVSYSLGGDERTTEVVPDSIYVKPMPELHLDYFLPEQVHGDNPYTLQVEPPVPFTLGVRVANHGYGAAHNLKIESSQPKIVENELGLLISFDIIGTEVGGKAAKPSLLADFGTIGAADSANARWLMTSTLQGKFIEFSATFSHADALGGALTSLLEEVDTHTLVHDVLVAVPGRDAVTDFLALDGVGYRVYESGHLDSTAVFEVTGATTVPVGGAVFTLATGPAAGFLYATAADPTGGQQVLTGATRSDGKAIHPSNVWQSKTWVKSSQSYLHWVNVFDWDNVGPFTYALSFGGAATLNYAPELGVLPDRNVRVGETLVYPVVATDANAFDSLSLQASPLPLGAVFEDLGNGAGTLTWSPSAAAMGSYPIQFAAYDGALFDSDVALIAVVPEGTPNSPPTSATATVVAEKNHASAPATPTVVDADVGDIHAFSVLTQPQNGSAIALDNALVYVPDVNFVGTDTFTFLAADLFGESVAGTANVIVVDGDDLVALSVEPVGPAHAPTSVKVAVDNDGSVAGIIAVTTTLSAHGCGGTTVLGSASHVLGAGVTEIEFPVDLAGFGDEPVVLVADVDTTGALPEADEFNNRVARGVRAGSAGGYSVSLASTQASPVDVCAGQVLTATGRSHFILHESTASCLGPMAAGAAVGYALEDATSGAIVRQGTVWADGNGAWHVEFGLPAEQGTTYELRMVATDGSAEALLVRELVTHACPPALPPPMVPAPPFPGPHGDVPTVRFVDPAAFLPWVVHPGLAIPSAGPAGSGSFGHVRGTGSSGWVRDGSPALGALGGAVDAQLFDASVGGLDIGPMGASFVQGSAATLHGVVVANDSVYGVPLEWRVTEPSGAPWLVAPPTWYYANGPLHVIATYTPRVAGLHGIELSIGEGFEDADGSNDAAGASGEAAPAPPPPAPVLSALVPSELAREMVAVAVVEGTNLTAAASLACGEGVLVEQWAVALDEGSPTFGSTATATVTVAADAPLGMRDCTISTAYGTSTLAGALNVVEALCASVQCDAPPGACHESAGTCDPHTGACVYGPLPQGAPCADAFACTTGDACDGAGTCGLANSLDCNDGIPCTVEHCDSQSGCSSVPQTLDCNAAGCLAGGDVNGNNGLNVTDAMCLVLTALWALAPSSTEPRPACLAGPTDVADMNCSASIDVADVQLVILRILGDVLSPQIDANDNGCPDTCESAE